MNWWQMLIPLVLQIVQRILDRRLPKAAGAPTLAHAESPAGKSEDQSWRELTASNLENALKQSPKAAAGAPVGHEGGIVQHVTELVAALRSGDWNQIQKVVIDLLSHL